MTTLTVNIPDTEVSRLDKFLKTIGGEVINSDDHKMETLKGLEESFCEVREMRAGKLPKLSLREALRD